MMTIAAPLHDEMDAYLLSHLLQKARILPVVADPNVEMIGHRLLQKTLRFR